MLDVGNFLAHLQWTDHFGRKRQTDVSGAYREQLRSKALDRFGWRLVGDGGLEPPTSRV